MSLKERVLKKKEQKQRHTLAQNERFLFSFEVHIYDDRFSNYTNISV